YLGPPRDDGLHEIRSLFEPLSLADRIEVTEATAGGVVGAGVRGETLATRARAVLRERGWEGPPGRVEIEKRIPLAGGLGGGSADAAAVRRLCSRRGDGLGEAAAELGADVPTQLRPAFSLVGGAGGGVEQLPVPARHAVVLLPDSQGL